MRAQLHEKSIHELRLRWGKEGNQDEDVLEGLQPHSNLQRLEIDGYAGKNLPLWMLKSNCSLNYEMFLLKNLVELKIGGCKKLESIPVMDGFSSLRPLDIQRCHELSTIPDGAFAALTPLQELLIRDCHKLDSVSVSELPSLEKLKIVNCDVSSIGDILATSRCLKELDLFELHKLRFIPSLDGLTSLQKLNFVGCGLFKGPPSGLTSCTALEELTIHGCHNLISIPQDLKELRSIVNLNLANCSKLRSIPGNPLNYLTSLKNLTIGGFSKEIEEFPGLGSIHLLNTSLESLELFGWEKLNMLPPQIQHLTALKKLILSEFDEVETLPEWLGNLSSLKPLRISDCSRLRCLPKGLSSGTTLEELGIYDCPNLIFIPEETLDHLTQLKSLRIGPLSTELEEFPGLSSIHHLHTCLEELWLWGWEKLTQLPHQIQHLTALKYLSVNKFDGLEVLPEWLGNLASLHQLMLGDCKNLKHLPSAGAIRGLSKFLHIQIHCCPLLEERCAEENGPEWSRISHFQTININYQYV
ncbi:hypothetical protein SLA2020_370780 [Shorea laevis]